MRRWLSVRLGRAGNATAQLGHCRVRPAVCLRISSGTAHSPRHCCAAWPERPIGLDRRHAVGQTTSVTAGLIRAILDKTAMVAREWRPDNFPAEIVTAYFLQRATLRLN